MMMQFRQTKEQRVGEGEKDRWGEGKKEINKQAEGERQTNK